MRWLDEHVEVETWTYEGVRIPYVSNVKSGRVRNYYPDFLVTFKDGSRLLVEVKPKKRLQQAIVKKKLKAAEEWCVERGVTLTILTENELVSIGLL